MSDTGYVIWFVVTALLTTGILATLVMEAMGVFSHGRKPTGPRNPSEAKQYWPHTSGIHH